VKDVNLYLNARDTGWNIEVPFRYVPDVKWRLRKLNLRDADIRSAMDSDEYSSAFSLRGRGEDASLDEDAKEIVEVLRRHRIFLAPWSRWELPPA